MEKDIKKEVKQFIDYLEEHGKNASKQTHYHNLSAWAGPVYDYIHNKLDEHGFVNGDVEANKDNKNVNVWFKVYDICSSWEMSKHLKTNVARHHASAYERNVAIVLDLKDFEKNYL